jgi:hypothetical protein
MWQAVLNIIFFGTSDHQYDNPILSEIHTNISRFSQGILEESDQDMPYKDSKKQREYLRNWRQQQKLHKVIQLPPQSLRHSNQNDHVSNATSATSNSNVFPVFLYQPMTGQLRLWSRLHQPAQQSSVREVDQRALKTSPDGAPQTGRSAVQAYQISRRQFSTPGTDPKRPEARRPPGLWPVQSRRQYAVPIAAILVEVLSKMFS